MGSIKVSAVMISYNHEPYIKQAIEGVLMQKTAFPIELIIGEDFSSDNTRKICEEYEHLYPDKINLLPTEKNYGMMPNLIRTLNACAGKYIALCEGDDYWTDPLKLQKQVDFLEGNPEYSMCFTSANKYYQNNKKMTEWHINLKKKDYLANDILFDLVIPTCTAVFRNNKKLININQKPEYIFGDMILWLNSLEFGKIFCLPVQTAVYRKSDDAVTANMDINKQLLLLKQHETIAKDFNGKYYQIESRLLSRQYMVIALKMLFKRDRRSITYLLKSFKKKPSRLPANFFYVVKRLIKRDYSL